MKKTIQFRIAMLSIFLGGLVMGQNSFAQENELEFIKLQYVGTDHLVETTEYSVYGNDIGPNGNLYVGNYRHNSILVYDQDLNLLSSMNDIKMPHGVAVDKDGNIYVSTWANGRFIKYSPDLKEVENWDKKLRDAGVILRPVASVSDENGTVYLADYDKRGILKIDPQGQLIKSFDVSSLDKDGKFQPHGIALYKGRVYVADRGNLAVHIFSKDGEFMKTFDPPDGAIDPLSIGFTPQGQALVPTYKGGSPFYLYDSEGKFIKRLGKIGVANGEYLMPMDFAGDDKGFIYVVEQNGNRIQKIKVNGI